MKRFVAAINKKLGSLAGERKANRIIRALNTVKDNALDKIEELENRKEDLVEKLPEVTNVNCFVQQLSDLIEAQEGQRAIIARLDNIRSFLEEDVPVE